MKTNKTSTCRIKVLGDGFTMSGMKILNPDGTTPSRGFLANKNVKFLWVKAKNAFYLVSTGATISASKMVYTCTDQETVISYKDLSYNNGDLIQVYRNGVRLFQDLDYSVNEAKEEITLYVRTEDGEIIVFESISA